MKKMTAILLAVSLAAALAGCAKGNSDPTPPPATPTPVTQPSATPEPAAGLELTEENGVLTCLDSETSPFEDCALRTVVDKQAKTVTFTKATPEGQDTQEYYLFRPEEHMMEQFYYVSMMGTGFYYYYDTDLGEMVRMEDKDHNDTTESSKASGRYDGAAQRVKADATALEAYFSDSFGMTIAEAIG